MVDTPYLDVSSMNWMEVINIPYGTTVQISGLVRLDDLGTMNFMTTFQEGHRVALGGFTAYEEIRHIDFANQIVTITAKKGSFGLVFDELISPHAVVTVVPNPTDTLRFVVHEDRFADRSEKLDVSTVFIDVTYEKLPDGRLI